MKCETCNNKGWIKTKFPGGPEFECTCPDCHIVDNGPLRCDVLRPGWISGCQTQPKWWWCEDPDSTRFKWHPRCGMHARLPGNTKCARVPLFQRNPNEPLF